MAPNPLTQGRHAVYATMETADLRHLKRTSTSAVVRQAVALELIKRGQYGHGEIRSGGHA